VSLDAQGGVGIELTRPCAWQYTKDEILAGALATAFEGGLSQLTFGRVAKHLDITDRMVVYYFPSKDDLISEVILSMGLELQAKVALAFNAPAADYLELAQTAWPILAHADSDAVFGLFFEANGLAAAGREPYASLVELLIASWVEFAAEFVQGTPAKRRAEAEATIALIDGLLLLRALAGPKAATRAAKRLGVQ